MDTSNLLFWLRDAMACLGTLVGLGAAIFLFTRKKTNLAILALVGFLLLGIEPLLDVVFFRILMSSPLMNMSWHLDYVYACCSGTSMLFGSVLIAVALFLGFRPEPVKEEEKEEVPAPQV